jgi:hypothetical protein
MPSRVIKGRKLLVASIGVATMSYVAYSCGNATNPTDAQSDSQADAQSDSQADTQMNDVPVANLALPPDAHAMDSGVDDMPIANLAIPPG